MTWIPWVVWHSSDLLRTSISIIWSVVSIFWETRRPSPAGFITTSLAAKSAMPKRPGTKKWSHKRQMQSSYGMFLRHCGQSLRREKYSNCTLYSSGDIIVYWQNLMPPLSWLTCWKKHLNDPPRPQWTHSNGSLRSIGKGWHGLASTGGFQYQADIVTENQIVCWILLVHCENCRPFTGILLNKRKKHLNKHHLKWRGDNNMAAGGLLAGGPL